MDTMQTIQIKLTKVKESANALESIMNNYNMGLITITEMHYQTQMVLDIAKEKIQDICDEYEINVTAVTLMLTM